MKNKNTYTLLDSGRGRKLERFGSYAIGRPCAQAVWEPQLSEKEWTNADAYFSREQGNEWIVKKPLPKTWDIEISDIQFKLSSTDFGHLGIFPEQKEFWSWIQNFLKDRKSQPKVLNLFAYSGGSTMAAAKAGASVCHLDSSKGMVSWARDNASLNKLENASIRWIVDDVNKFLIREQRRGSLYDAIILDPPTFGRGSKGEVFKIDEQIIPILHSCRSILSSKPLFLLFSCHTPGFTPLVMHHLLSQTMANFQGEVDSGEMTLSGDPHTLALPSGTFARWISHVH